MDSVVITYFLLSTKENLPPKIYPDKLVQFDGQNIDSTFHIAKKDSVSEYNEQEKITIVGRAKLSRTEASEFILMLKNRSSYDFKHSIALLNDVDLSIDYYIKGNVMQEVNISTYTRNITIVQPNCNVGRKYDKVMLKYIKPNTDNVCFFQNSISKNLEKYIALFLTEKKIWKKGTTFKNLWEQK